MLSPFQENMIWLLTVITNLATISAAVFVAIQVRLMARSRESEAFLKVIETSNTDSLKDAADWLKYETAENLTYELVQQREYWTRISTIVRHFEMIGILVKRRHICRKLIYDQMSLWVVGSWSKLEPVISEHRRRKGLQEYAENFQDLAENCVAWQSGQGGTKNVLAMKHYYREEKHSAAG